MLKRYQVLIPLWLEEYIQHLVEVYDLSFSEILRAEICCSVLMCVPGLYPEYEKDFNLEEIFKKIRGNQRNKIEIEELHKILSRIYFEARKAAEYRLAKEKKGKKK